MYLEKLQLVPQAEVYYSKPINTGKPDDIEELLVMAAVSCSTLPEGLLLAKLTLRRRGMQGMLRLITAALLAILL
jgi:hypothetical protein